MQVAESIRFIREICGKSAFFRVNARQIVVALSAWLLAWGLVPHATADDEVRATPLRRDKRPPRLDLPPEVAALAGFSVVLGRPTDHAVTASLVAQVAGDAYIEFTPAPGQSQKRSELVSLSAQQPRHVLLAPLPADQRVSYRAYFRAQGERQFTPGPHQSFHTQRPPGSRFVFELQGDSHPERRQQFDPAWYGRTLRGVAADEPDFYFLMGDDFSVDTLPEINAESVTQRYRLQRPFLALVGQRAPLFLVNGNHEQAALANFDGQPDNVAVWAQNARDAFFPQPAPDAFYAGNPVQMPHIGWLRNYFAWHWGDALFVVIDPYWHSAKPVDNVLGGGAKNRDLWAVTLGEAQYRWLQDTLANSKARYKFVFSHHVLGSGRGGVELAGMYEWGGRNRKGVDEFQRYRPGWAMPIHALFVKHRVSIFFQGHDHLFARQELDGVVYQTLPQPADPNEALHFPEAYQRGDRLPNSGRVRVSVSPEKARVEYIRTSSHDGGTTAPEAVAYSYEVLPAR